MAIRTIHITLQTWTNLWVTVNNCKTMDVSHQFDNFEDATFHSTLKPKLCGKYESIFPISKTLHKIGSNRVKDNIAEYLSVITKISKIKLFVERDFQLKLFS